MLSWQGRLLTTLLRIRRRLARQPARADVARHRAEIDRMGRWFAPLGPIDCEPVTAGGVPAEWILPPGTPPERAILFLHGGSFVAGSIASHRTLAGNIALTSRARVLLAEYRLAPEHPFPAAVEDTTAAYEWLVAQGCAPGQIVAAGDSAGGTLAAALLLHLRNQGRLLPAGAMCLSPCFDLTFGFGSWASNRRKDLMLDAGRVSAFVRLYLGDADPRAPEVSPYYADLRGLPPMLIQVGADEILLSDSQRFAAKARADGVDVWLEVWAGGQHEFQYAARILPEARQALAHVGAFVRRVTEGGRDIPNGGWEAR